MRWTVAAMLAGVAAMTSGVRAAAPAGAAANGADGGRANVFALDLYGKLAAADEKGNLFFSPYSVDVALEMAATGARGATAAEFAGVLHEKGDGPGSAASLMKSLNPPGDGAPRPFALTIANALWVDQRFPILATYTHGLQKSFGVADVFSVNFQGEAEAARQSINGWVEDHTQKKITDLVPAGAITPDTRVVLTNAIYFKASWQTEFQASGTENQPFHAATGKDVTVPLMHLQHAFAYQETDDAQIVGLPYKTSERGASEMSMWMVLPKKADGLAAVEKTLTADALGKWTAAAESKLVSLYLPRFKSTSTLPLNKPLEALGLRTAFSKDADFTGIAAGSSPDEKLHISDVLHKAYISVDEHGTEAAAATAIMMGTMAMRVDKPVEMRADHPFVYVIRDDASGAILFMGRLCDATAK